jgi:hypothetical protein
MARPGSTKPDLLEFDPEAVLAAFPQARRLAEYLNQHPEELRLFLALSPEDRALVTARIVWDQRMRKPPKGSSVGELASWCVQREQWTREAAAETAAMFRRRSVRVWRRPAATLRLRRVRRVSGVRTRRRRTLRTPRRGPPGRADDPEPGPRTRRFPNKLILLWLDAFVRLSGVWGRLHDELDDLEERAA